MRNQIVKCHVCGETFEYSKGTLLCAAVIRDGDEFKIQGTCNFQFPGKHTREEIKASYLKLMEVPK